MIVTFNLPVSSASPSTAFVSLTTDCTYPSTSAIASVFPLKSLKKLASILVACFNWPSLPTYGASLYPPVILTFVTSWPSLALANDTAVSANSNNLSYAG